LAFLPLNAQLDSTAFKVPKQLLTDSLGESFFVRAQALVNEAELQEKTQKSFYAPDLTLGYFNQSLERQNGFYGYYLGVKAPIWWWGNQNNVEQAKLKKEQTQLMSNYQLNEKKQNLQALNQSLSNTEMQLQNLQKQLNNTTRLAALSKKSLTQGELSYMQYFQQQQILIDAQLSFFDLKKQEANTLFQIQFLSK
jgi:cobalt-zinc-cadmium resistance protein CzcA